MRSCGPLDQPFRPNPVAQLLGLQRRFIPPDKPWKPSAARYITTLTTATIAGPATALPLAHPSAGVTAAVFIASCAAGVAAGEGYWRGKFRGMGTAMADTFSAATHWLPRK